MANVSHDDLIKALELRYDYLSARTMATALLGGAGVDKAPTYDAKAAASLAAACEAVIGTGAERVAAALSGCGAPAAKAAPAKAEKAEAAPAKAEEAAEKAAPAKKPAKKAAAKGKKKK